MTHGVPALGYSFWQALGPAILLTSILIFKNKNSTTTTSKLKYYFICALTGVVIPNTNMYFASPHLPAGLLAVIVNTVPIIAYPLALLGGIEKYNFRRLMGIVIAIIGLMLILTPKSSLPSPHMIPWVLSVLITPISFAFCSVYIARFRPANTDSLGISAGTLIFASMILLPFVLYTHTFYTFHWLPTIPDWVVLLEIVLSSIGYVLFFQLIKIAGPVYYSLVDTIVALTGLAWGYILFHEHLNAWTAPAVFCILIGLLLVSSSSQKKID